MLQIVRDHLHAWDPARPRVALAVDRQTLAKRRWRGVASDGAEFGFDLERPLADGDVFFQSEMAVYHLAQCPEPVLEIPLGTDPTEAARLGWRLGNLHFPFAVAADARVALAVDDPAVRQMLARERIPFTPAERVFRPFSGGHSPHGHAHGHGH